MAELSPPLRLARPEDGPALADLVNFAGEGLPLYLWEQIAEEGEDPFAVGARRQAERAARGEIVVVDEGLGVLAAMTGYPIRESVTAPETMPPMWRVLQELENKVVGTWYLNVLATYPRARGHGHGARLIAYAEQVAKEEGLEGVSIIVADQNLGARRLYERLGYSEIDRADMVKNGWETQSSEWILLKKATP